MTHRFSKAEKVALTVHLTIIVVLCLVAKANAATYPDVFPSNAPMRGALYIEAQTSQLGRVLIIVPIAYQEGSLTQLRSSNDLFNITNGTISGQVYYGTNWVNSRQWRMQRLAGSEYNTATTGTANYVVLTITQIHNTNVILADNNGENPIATVKPDIIYSLIIIFLLGVIVLCQFFKRS